VEKRPNLDLIMTSYVEGIGNVGDRVSVKSNYGYNKLLLPKLAVYATEENIKKYENIDVTHQERERHSSPSAASICAMLSRQHLSIVMNKDTNWTIKPWHIRMSFRKSGIRVPEDAIELPEKPISGPNMDLEHKIFFVNVTINNMEKARVLCRLHHWATEITERIPYEEQFWKNNFDPIFPEDAAEANERKQTMLAVKK